MSRWVFRHEAMATWFEIVVDGAREEYARQAVMAAFREVDRLEGELSRFVETSDIARINRLAEGGSLVIGEPAFECLLIAARCSEMTGRAFDPAFRSRVERGEGGDVPLLALDPTTHTVTALCEGLRLDLGAIGKGFALDRCAEILGEWGISSALLQAGGSTVLALDPPAGEAGWEVGVAERIFKLARGSISGSGLGVQGEHIADPRAATRAWREHRTWAQAKSGAESDALSTAFFVMRDAEVTAFCERYPDYGAVLMRADGTGLRLGSFSELREPA